MRRVYVLMYNDALGTRAEVKTWADNCGMVITWRYDLPHCIYLVSTSSASEISEELRKVAKPGARYLITEVSENRQGLMPAETWYLLRYKKNKPKQ